MDSSRQSVYHFEDVEIDLSRECLRRNDGERHLRKKAFQVLACLLENRERVVTKEELIGAVWNDAFVTDDVLVQCVKDIRRALGDSSQAPRFIKTIPKSGYRFIGAVSDSAVTPPPLAPPSEVEIEASSAAAAGGEKPAPKNFLHTRFDLLAFASLVAAAIVIFGFAGKSLWRAAPSPAETVLPQTPGKKTLAVMFFENRSQSPEIDWLREGLADMLITNLSRSPKLTVLGRQQLHLLLERAGCPAGEEVRLEMALEVARRSRAESFIVGGFSKIGEKIRLDVQLHGTQTGALQTTESLIVERPDQIFSDMDLLSFKLAKILDAAGAGGGPKEAGDATALAAVMTNNLEAYRNYSLAVEKANAMHNQEALALLEKAVALDGQFAMAYARIGYIYAVTWGLAEKAKPFLEKAFSLSDKLSEKDRLNIAAWYAIANLDYPAAIQSFRELVARYPLETEAYLRLGILLRGEEQLDEAVEILKQGLAVDPDAHLIYNSLGLIFSSLGRHEEAIAMHRRYVQLRPDEPNSHDSLAMSYQWAGLYDEAIQEYRRALELKPDFEVGVVHLANAYFQTGRYREAIGWYEKYVRLAPSDYERARGYTCLSQIYRRMKNDEMAERYARQAFQSRSQYAHALMILAFERGHLSEAKNFESLIFAKPVTTSRGAKMSQRYELFYRGYIALKNQQSDVALANFQEAVRRQPPTFEIDSMEDCYANALLELGRLDEAVAEYERILRLNPRYPLARFHLARALEQKGLAEEARVNYEHFLEDWKDADETVPEIRAARKFLQKS